MAKIDSTIATIAVAFVAAAAVSMMLRWQPNTNTPFADGAASNTAASSGESANLRAQPQWAASATGRIEPKGGQVKLAASVEGEIAAVAVTAHQQVQKGDLLVRIDDVDYLSRIASAEAEAEVRRRERDEEAKTEDAKVKERRDASDAAEVADRALFAARQALDKRLETLAVGDDTTDLVNLRQAVKDKEQVASEARRHVENVSARDGMPLPERLEVALIQARSDLRLAYQALERTRVRAPANGTVLRVDAKAGELAAPSLPTPLVTFGDLTQMVVRAEVEERDVSKVRIGQRVVVHSDAFPGKEFAGHVTEIASALGSPNIVTRGPRRPDDVDVLEVLATLDETTDLVTGLRVDVFFAHPETAEAKK